MRTLDAWNRGVCFVCWGAGRYVCTELLPKDPWAWPPQADWPTARCWRCRGTGRFPTPPPDDTGGP